MPNVNVYIIRKEYRTYKHQKLLVEVTSQNLETDMWKQWHEQRMPRSPVLLSSRSPPFRLIKHKDQEIASILDISQLIKR